MAKHLLLFLFIITQSLASFSQSPWYHHTTIYQVYPRSYYDSNGDGIGDIQGIIQKLDYIKALGFETVWCSPFFSSPQKDFGYDISDYKGIAPEYGTMTDAEQLIAEVHKRDMKIVMDMVMNHTSLQHPWFARDVQAGKGNKNDFYIWVDKPNNWKSLTGGDGWHYSPERGQYFWASFLPFQPDLNYRNPEVKKAMLGNVRFWLEKGADGFRLDIFNVLYKDSQMRDNPFSWKAVPSETNPDGFFQKMKYTINQPESMEFAKELRAVCNEYGEKMLIGEVTGDRETIRKFAGAEKNDGLGLVFNFEMLRFKFKASYFEELISNVEQAFPEPFMPVYVFSNHDRRRSIKRLKDDTRKAALLHTLQLTTRGVPCMYYGEEIGMTDARIPYKKGLDPIAQKMRSYPRILFDMAGETMNRDEMRTPMQWNDSTNAGFSTAGTTWLPVNENYHSINTEKEAQTEGSLLKTIEQLLKVRNSSDALRYGSIELIATKELPKHILAFIRKTGTEEVIIYLNFGKQAKAMPIGTSTTLYLSGSKVQDGIVTIEGYGAAIFRK